ncbi:hypothetical protein HY02_08125 [Peptococcaceae bacterium SCADC1_2_3]|jgi:hypothetical protein|nr:hypothetical protein DK28_0203515 [Peptococcaceae bacterium SCADC1_2_3]KFI35858.1 hypothetical protein HY00_00930 [Peptococcaceae bacterium SCADC1_2_3]KFI37329.1 hypothetical protein HY02_08125 [Peptococcaceae bacterium SCADC1_2_3]HBQ28173.1 hypothetical protein [Desulfotomaculum sp.]HCJ78824.1 hypothetical protein [Desulfotomaculum sp.]
MKANLTIDEFPIVKDALQRELVLLEAKLRLIKKEVNGFEKEFNMSSNKFIQDFEQGILGDDKAFFEWWGLVQGAKKLEGKMAKIKAVLFS